ncbi:MAG: sugar ABC transporter substrate-binding protein [Eubacteriales bacterium]|nr:sugar ABC transporter substrate-binding protein [Eubacteriales bacterium]
MKKMKLFLSVVSAVFIFMALGGCGESGKKAEQNSAKEKEDEAAAWKEASETPLGRYPETVTYTLGQMSGANNSNLPEGDSYNDNAYTRYLKKVLNIQNQMVYSESEDRYGEMEDILVNDHNLPDVLVISDQENLKRLVENDLVEDLTEVYETCTTPRIKEMYESYGGEIFKSVEFDGRLMALPETVIDHGPCLLWLRKDWMDELGLEEPSNMEEAFGIIREFRRNRMGAEEGEEPLGLVCDIDLVGKTSSSYSVDPIFDMFGAKPQRWQEDENGKIIYGSLTQETREALMYLNTLYEEGVLDRDFALRAPNNLRDLVVNGKCGAFFGLWWTPNNPLMDGWKKNKAANWEPYYFPEDRKESANPYNSSRDSKFVVVRKGYEHPEIVMKIISVLFDYSRYEAEDAQEMTDYFALNVDPTARPLVINVDYNEETYQVTRNIRKVLSGEMEEEKLSAIEKSYYEACRNYLDGGEYTAEDWAAYKSRISAVGLLVDGGYVPPKRRYLTKGDREIPQALKILERNAFIQIIMGEQDISYFDTFVEEWYAQGGKELTDAIN